MKSARRRVPLLIFPRSRDNYSDQQAANGSERCSNSRILLELKGLLRVLSLAGHSVSRPCRAFSPIQCCPKRRGLFMVVTAAHITPLVAILAGILILIIPRLLNYIVAIYLIFVGLVELNAIHHFVNWH